MTEMHEGGCLCGAVRYRATADPMRVTICHCTFCQRFTGAAFQALAALPRSAFQATGQTHTYDHRSDESGAIITMHSCPTCATTVFVDLERFPDAIGIISGTFDNPNWVPRTSPRARHVFTRSACAGTVLSAGVDIYRGAAFPADGSKVKPIRLNEPVTVGPQGGLPKEIT